MKRSDKQKQQIIDEILLSIQYRDNDYPVVSSLDEVEKGFKGWVVEINDHGNATIWNHFKNGNCREIASKV